MQNSGRVSHPVSIKNSIDLDLLQSLIDLGEFPNINKLEDLADAVISSWLKLQNDTSIGTLFLKDFEEQLEASVVTNMGEKDIKIRIRSLLVLYLTFLRKNKGEKLLYKNLTLCYVFITYAWY